MLKLLRKKYNNLISDQKFSEILTGSVYVLLARVSTAVIGMITIIIIARYYGAEITGILAMVDSFLFLTTIFTVMGINTSILRLIPEHIVKFSPTSAFNVYRKSQCFVIVVSVICGGIFFSTSGLIADFFFSKPHLSKFFSWAAFFVVFFSIMTLNIQAVRGLKLIRTFAFIQLLPSISKLLILLFLTVFFFDPYNPIYALLASYGIVALISATIMQIEFKKRIAPNDIISDMPLKDIISISFPMVMTATMSFFTGQIGVFFLGIFRSETEVGYFSIAVKLATLTTFVLNAINSMAAPKFSELFHNGNMEELFYMAKKSTKLIFWTTTPVLISLIIFGKLILKFLFGPEFITAYSSMVFLVIGQFVNSLSGSTSYFMNMTGNHKEFRNIVMGAAAINVGISLILIPSFGIIGAACAGMICIIFWNIGTLIFIKLKYCQSIGYIPLKLNLSRWVGKFL